jgi:copper(I)-binding protein
MVFAPGGNHIMIMGLKKPLMTGDHFPLMLKTKRGEMLTIDVAVQKEAPAP